MRLRHYFLGAACFFGILDLAACQPYEEEMPALPPNKTPMLVTVAMLNYEVLRRPARAVEFPLDLQEKFFIQEMQNFFNASKSPLGKPVGLSAPQLGMPWRIILIQIPPEAKKFHRDVYDEWPPTILINPTYEPITKLGKKKDWESCHSIPNRAGEVYRYNAISYTAYDMNGQKITGIAKGFLARYIQHEVDHLNGILYTDLLCTHCRYGDLRLMLKIRAAEKLP